MRKLAIIVLMALLLAACDEGDEPLNSPVDGPVFVASPVAALTDCETGDLENWYENFSVNAPEFVAEMTFEEAPNERSALSTVTTLSDLRDAINEVSVPSCVLETHQTQQALMGTAIDAYMNFIQDVLTGEQLSLILRAESERYYAQVAPQLEITLGDLNSRFNTNR